MQIICNICKKIFKTQSGTVVLPESRNRLCLDCIELMSIAVDFIDIYLDGE
mgnify:CR=1 FL=1